MSRVRDAAVELDLRAGRHDRGRQLSEDDAPDVDLPGDARVDDAVVEVGADVLRELALPDQVAVERARLAVREERGERGRQDLRS